MKQMSNSSFWLALRINRIDCWKISMIIFFSRTRATWPYTYFASTPWLDFGFKTKKSNTFSSIAAASSTRSSWRKINICRDKMHVISMRSICVEAYRYGKIVLSVHVKGDSDVTLVESLQVVCLCLFLKIKHHLRSIYVIFHAVTKVVLVQQTAKSR